METIRIAERPNLPVFALAWACAPGMKAKGWGRVINLTSLALNGQWEG